jgi:leucyl aminopeptidase (aminopeptidase T)
MQNPDVQNRDVQKKAGSLHCTNVPKQNNSIKKRQNACNRKKRVSSTCMESIQPNHAYHNSASAQQHVAAQQYSTSAGTSSTFARQHKLFEDFILALCESGKWDTLPKKTTFILGEEEILEQMLENVIENCPELVKNRKRFMQAVERIVFGAV